MEFVNRIQYSPDCMVDKIDTSLTLLMYEKEKDNQQWLFDLLRTGRREDNYSVCPYEDTGLSTRQSW